MMTHDVRFWAVRPNTSSKRKKTYEVRWKVGGRQKSRTFETKALASAFLLDLQMAAKRGEAFDIDTGLPESMMKAKEAVSFLAFCLAYVDMKWPHAAANSRDAMTEALATAAPALVHEDAADGPTPKVIRTALRSYYLAPQDRERTRPAEIAHALAWLEKYSLPMAEVAKTRHIRAALNALTLKLDGMPAAASTVARKRTVLYNACEYAVELEEFVRNPIDQVNWKAPKLAEAVDWRVVINPRQANEALTAATYVGRRGRGRRLRALYGCMYYAALRPAEAVALTHEDCHLPETGWGYLVVSKTLPESATRWTDSGTTHERRGLKLRPVSEVRTVPIPPILVRILQEHIEEFGTAPDGRIFQTERGGIVGSTAYGDVWAATRVLAFTPAQVASPLARRPYDLRHAGVSLWLNSGVAATDVAERAGHSVKVLLQIYAKCIDGQQETANRRIDDALDE